MAVSVLLRAVMSALLYTLVGLVGGGLITFLVAHHYYVKASEVQERAFQNLKEDLKYHLGNLHPYVASLQSALDTLEGKDVEGVGRIIIERDADGNPHKIRLARPQVIRPEGIPSEEAFGEPTVLVGPPPTPPPSIVELENTVQGQGTMSGDLIVGHRPWWKRFLGLQ